MERMDNKYMSEEWKNIYNKILNGEIMSENTCVCCGETIPEGRQVCSNCEHEPLGLINKIIAVDFDGTIRFSNYDDEEGEPNLELINYLIEQQDSGAVIILWTCRTGKKLKEAIEYCKKYGLYFDRVNENDPSSIAKYKGDSRKIFAHEYIDDKACCIFKRKKCTASFCPYYEDESFDELFK